MLGLIQDIYLVPGNVNITISAYLIATFCQGPGKQVFVAGEVSFSSTSICYLPLAVVALI